MELPQDIPVDAVWPTHAGHRIIYSEYGRTDYLLASVSVTDRFEGVDTFTAEEYDNRPTDGDITETEISCQDCGVVLDRYLPTPSL